MSNSFGGIQVIPYRGTTFRLPVTLPQGLAPPPNLVPPSVCPVTIDWNVYWQIALNPNNVGVYVDLQARSTQQFILDRIASVKIDNTGSANPVYVQFPDTGDVINCPANCSVTFPALTGKLQFIVYAIGLLPGFIPTTKVFAYNISLPPSVDAEVNQSLSLYRQSPAISRGTTILNENYGPPALGDQIQAVTLNLQSGASADLWNTPINSGGYIIVQSLFVQVWSDATPDIQMNYGFEIRATGAAGQLLPMSGYMASVQPSLIALQMYGMNLKLDATQHWEFSNDLGLSSGSATLYTSYTFSNF